MNNLCKEDGISIIGKNIFFIFKKLNKKTVMQIIFKNPLNFFTVSNGSIKRIL